ncbi:MAG: type VI secretion system ATPase TssH, partial [Clostridia bacterium]|nr:type VI secretion system ATPase TssH [Clostridia bacterium]
MDMNRFTQKSIEAIQSAQSTAQQYGNSQLEPVHLLFALLSQEDGLIPNLLTKMGVQSGAFRDSVEALLARLPRISGSNQQPYPSSAFTAALSQAESEMRQMGDEYISVEHLFLALLAR